MPEVFVGLGSNARPVQHLRLACDALRTLLAGPVFSNVYESRAVGKGEGRYLNMVAGGHTALAPASLQGKLRDIEDLAGRLRGDAAVTLDLDLLLYGDAVIPELRLPRDDVLEHAFVLGPLVELAPTHRHPVTGQPFRDHWAAFPGGAAGLRVLGRLEALALESG
ncbi:MAG: 2-amino-4-hydroxy-6-hydroxymethyldihydropteridine diphosphokinase [Gammaproteobacteria bacterium]|nr:2-amino-4-hydroxy-6-hydroxymethyldihydropteridine diphosphokinase [Gammaproteobacteria bacterium]